MGRVGQQSQGEVLRADARRLEAARGGNGRVGQAHRGRVDRDEDGLMFSDLRLRLRALFRRDVMERELADELRFHLEHAIDKNMRAGMSRADAERRARIEFGGVERIKDDARDARGVAFLDTVSQDVRYAWRALRSKPGFTAAVVVTLGLGIGANTAMFGIVDRLLFRAPSYLIAPERVHRVYLNYSSEGRDRTERTTEYARYVDLARWTNSFDRAAAIAYRSLPVGSGEETRELPVAVMSASFFRFFDARPVIGRFFNADDDRAPAGSPVAVLGYGFWQTQLAPRTGIPGQAP